MPFKTMTDIFTDLRLCHNLVILFRHCLPDPLTKRKVIAVRRRKIIGTFTKFEWLPVTSQHPLYTEIIFRSGVVSPL